MSSLVIKKFVSKIGTSLNSVNSPRAKSEGRTGKMVRVITQQMFDDVVRENMNEFDLSIAEAIEDAIKQFEAQGVDLSNIVKTVEMAEGNDPVINCIRKLEGLVNMTSLKPVSLLPNLKTLKDECDRDISYRVLAGKEGAYPILLDIIDKFSNDKEVSILTLQTLASLMNGAINMLAFISSDKGKKWLKMNAHRISIQNVSQIKKSFPDLLDSRGVKVIISLLDTTKDTEILQNILKWCRICCVSHETNRQNLVNNDLILSLKGLLESKNATILPYVCAVIRSLTLDDDVRTHLSKAHDHAKSLAVEILCPLTAMISSYKGEKHIVTELLMTLSCLVVRNEFCAKVEEAGGIKFIFDALTDYTDDEIVTKNCLHLLKCLAGNDDVKFKIMQAGAAPLIIMALERHQISVGVCMSALALISVLALRSPSNSHTFVDHGAAEVIIQTMKNYTKNLKIQNTEDIWMIQRNGCWAIRNIVSRSRDLCGVFLKAGAEEIINSVIRTHKECDYDARSALRDLGCKVEFKEQWTGKGLGGVKH